MYRQRPATTEVGVSPTTQPFHRPRTDPHGALMQTSAAPRRGSRLGPPCRAVLQGIGRGIAGCFADVREEARVVLEARGTAREMRRHARDGFVRADAGELQVDVTVELVEAVVARQLGLSRPEQRCNQAAA